MVGKAIKEKLLIMLVIVILATTAVFVTLVKYNNKITKETASELGTMYMSKMMYLIQDQFAGAVKIKNQEAKYLVAEFNQSDQSDFRERLAENAGQFGFDYLAFYDDFGDYETIMGESAWYRNLSDFIGRVKAGESVTTTGYRINSGEKYLVLGVPAQYEMVDGREASVLLLGFDVHKLRDYIHIEQVSYGTSLDIILTNGSYVLNEQAEENVSYFDHILQYGSFVGLETAEGVAQIEKTMAGGGLFTYTVTLNDMTMHICGAPAVNPGDWYFVLSIPQSATDTLLNRQNTLKLWAFCLAGFGIFLLFVVVFLCYLRMSLRQMKEIECTKTEAEIANNAKSSFLSNMSHDIRTPMNAIAGFAVIAENHIRQGEEEEALAAISKMKRSSEYLRSLIGDVLDMSKIESGMLSLMPESVSLAETIDMVDTIAKARTEMKNQEYEFSVHDILHDNVECDQIRLQQILINLIGNAVKFTNDGGKVEFEVWQEASDKGGEFVRTCFAVKDNGIGMAPGYMESIFDSFSREESRVRRIEGTGLGLAISKKLVDMMGATLAVESREGKGSRFQLTVDMLKMKESVYADADCAANIEPGSIRILLAEDNDFNYEIAQVALENYGFSVCRAQNGGDAVKQYCNSPQEWDLILMDLRMPVLDGYQATERIRAFEHEQKPPIHVPIFALSADVFEGDIRQCMNVGMEGHISKPIDMEELLRKIRKCLK